MERNSEILNKFNIKQDKIIIPYLWDRFSNILVLDDNDAHKPNNHFICKMLLNYFGLF